MNLLEMMQARRSVRSYTGEPVPEEKLTAILQAGLLSATGKALHPWELIVVRDREMLDKLTGCRVGSGNMLKSASAAIIVLGNEDVSDVWIEDCSIVMSNMHLMADSLGVGSCWIQGRLRTTPEGKATEDFVRECIDFPENFRLEAILSLGMPESHPAAHELSELLTEKIHYEKF